MTIAYLIRAHHLPEQLGRLVRRLATESARFYVHVSAGTDGRVFAAMQRELAGVDHVTWTPRVHARYGGFSLLEAQLVGLEEIAASDPLPDHTLCLSGQDYPLVPTGEIETLLASRNGKSTAFTFPLPSDQWPGENGGLDRIRYVWFERFRVRSRLLRLPVYRRRFPGALAPHGGSSWWDLSPEALVHVTRFTRDNPRVVGFFRHVMYPDEVYIPTILMSSPHAGSVVNESLHYVDWSAGGAHPKVLGTEDLPRLLDSGKPFGRKFDVRHDAEVLDLLDERIGA